MSTLVCPTAMRDCDELLARDQDRPVVIAGGTGLLVNRPCTADLGALVDVTHADDAPPAVADLDGGSLRLSATAPLAAVHRGLGTRLPALRAAIDAFGSPQIRNRATIGGNLATASPAGDLLPVLITVDAVVRLRCAAGRRDVAITSFLLGPGRTALRTGEWIETVDVADAYDVQGFHKVGGRAAQAVTIISLAWRWTVGGDGMLSGVRLAVGAAAPTAVRCHAAEQILSAAPVTGERAASASAALSAALAPVDDIHGTADYRRAAAGGLLTEALDPLLTRR